MTSETRKRGSWLLGNDLVGHKWGKMEVIAQAERPEGNEVMHRGTWWLCRCECGKEKVLPRQYITQETTKSCGCLRVKPAKTSDHEEKTQKEQQNAQEGRVNLSKQDMINIRGILDNCRCKRCKKRFTRTSPNWQYTKKINGHRIDYCSWACYRGKDTGKKLTLTERARLQSKALR